MKITYYGYNSFIVQIENKKIAFDTGGDFYIFRFMKSIIPKSEWTGITHIFITHGDPDHYWHADRVAQETNSTIIFNKTMVREINGKHYMLGPRSRGLAFTIPIEKFSTVTPGETIVVDEIEVTGISTTHGVLPIRIGPFKKTLKPGQQERVGWGAIGFKIRVGNNALVNLGDTLLKRNEWRTIGNPDILMIPIGGIGSTMNEEEALEAVRIMKPKLVIPCHYNCAALFKKNANPVNERFFQKQVISMGYNCVILNAGKTIHINK